MLQPSIAALAGAAMALPALADDRAAQALAAMREAYRTDRIAERFTIEVAAQHGVADASEGGLLIDLDPTPTDTPAHAGAHAPMAPVEAPLRLDLVLGPLRCTAIGSRLIVTHAADADRFTDRLFDEASQRVLFELLPAVPLPQLAVALGPPAGDTLDLAPLLPPVRLDLLASTEETITLSGSLAPGSATLVLDAATHRLLRFEATIPAASGWYDMTVEVGSIGDHVADASIDGRASTDCPPGPGLEGRSPPDLDRRGRVREVDDLRPRGLVLVPRSELGWLPVVPADCPPTTLGGLVNSPALVALVVRRDDPAWLETAARLAGTMTRADPDVSAILLVFDESGRRHANWASDLAGLTAALAEAGATGVRPAWVDARGVPLRLALPPIDPGILRLDADAAIVAAVPFAEFDADPGELDRLRAAPPSAR
ncbi:MAG: hypothetical protein KDA05_05055 [Phycisphaerales bacterium]|nr:hypothetical protein [Phycisphaerales bacterium]